MKDYGYRNISELIGKTIKEVRGLQVGNDEVTLITEEGDVYKMYHEQSCCENVSIEDIDGSKYDLINALVINAEEVVGNTPNDFKWDYEPDSYTWTYYKIDTNKGGVTIRWLGTSNGYYSESVSFIDLDAYNRRWN